MVTRSVPADCPTRWRISAEADFNGDNLRDLVFQHQGDGRLAVWLMNRHAQVSGLALSPAQVPDLNWKVRGAGDFNGDFKPDLIWQHEMSGQVSACLMDGTTRPEGRLLSPSVVADTDWRIVGVADFNRDGHSDLLWQHQSSGLISIWHMNGVSRVDGVLLSPGQVADTNVKIYFTASACQFTMNVKAAGGGPTGSRKRKLCPSRATPSFSPSFFTSPRGCGPAARRHELC